MRFEKSCGGVVFTRAENEICYVIIRHTGGHCGFPKGHMEPGEDEQATALREVFEEVGLRTTLIDGFREEEIYPPPDRPGVMKQVVYFLAEYSGQDIRIQPEEVAEAYLLSYEEALSALTFQEAREILVKAHRFLGE